MVGAEGSWRGTGWASRLASACGSPWKSVKGTFTLFSWLQVNSLLHNCRGDLGPDVQPPHPTPHCFPGSPPRCWVGCLRPNSPWSWQHAHISPGSAGTLAGLIPHPLARGRASSELGTCLWKAAHASLGWWSRKGQWDKKPDSSCQGVMARAGH